MENIQTENIPTVSESPVSEPVPTTENKIDQPVQKPVQPTYGPSGAGEYLTPYQTTVIYHTNSVFESAVAVLSDRAQMIPITGAEIDWENLFAVPDHPSPEVLVFGTELSRENMLKFFARGFQLIHVFYASDHANDLENCPYFDKDENAEPVPFDPRVAPFGIETLYDHLYLVAGLTPLYLLEYIACAEFPKYKSIINNDINYTTGNHLLRAMKFAAWQTEDFGVKLLQLCATANGFDKVAQLIGRGQTIADINEHKANERLNNGLFFELEYDKNGTTAKAVTNERVEDVTDLKKYSVYAVSGTDVINEMLNLAPVHPKIVKAGANFVMFYSLEPHTVDNNTYPGWRVILIGINGAPNATEVLKSFLPASGVAAIGTHGIGSAWVATGDAKKLMPFIYP